jgi:hypothetical protein
VGEQWISSGSGRCVQGPYAGYSSMEFLLGSIVPKELHSPKEAL